MTGQSEKKTDHMKFYRLKSFRGRREKKRVINVLNIYSWVIDHAKKNMILLVG